MSDARLEGAPTHGAGQDVTPGDGADVLVRTATGNDLDAVVRIGRRTWPAIYEPLAGPEYVAMGLAKWWTPDVVTTSIRTGRTLVAEVGGTVVGMASYGTQGDEFVLWKLYVLPEHTGHGIGSKLMDAVVDRALESGYRRIRLSYADGNRYAARFHHAHGFVETHRESGGSGLPDSVWVVRELDAPDEPDSGESTGAESQS